MIICFDLDGTLCTTDESLPIPDRYYAATVKPAMRDVVQYMYKKGYTILIDTARASSSRGLTKYWKHYIMKRVTARQLSEWNVPYHRLRVGVKFAADLYIDDKATTPGVFEKRQ